MNELEQKEKFAKLFLDYGGDLLASHNFKAAIELFPEDTRTALKIATEWPHDSEVKGFIKKIQDFETSIDSLPSKKDLAEDIWKKMQKPYVDPKEYAALAKLYAEVRGFIEKPENKQVVNINQNRVMVIKDQGSPDEWSNKAEKQQRDLVNVSTSRH